MPHESVFRLSLYLTLGLACVCVGYAEHELFPEVPYLAGIVVVALAMLYWWEGRIELLTIPQANRLGLVIGLVNLLWAGYRVYPELSGTADPPKGLQLVLVAVVGPLLITSVLGKLARREKHIGDYWGLHGAGLAAVALSGALADDAVSFVLAGVYAWAAVWSLLLLEQRRSAGAIPPLPNRPPPPRPAGVVGESTGLFVRPAVVFTGLVLLAAVPLYLFTPQSGAEKLNWGKPRVEIGYAADQMIDLRRTGRLKPNPALAFEVTAEEVDGRPKTDLPPDLRWRGRVLRLYEKGTWQTGDFPLPAIDALPRNSGGWRLPRLGEPLAVLTFSLAGSLDFGLFLAEPVRWVSGEPTPVATLTPAGPQPWTWVGDGSLFWSGRRHSPSQPLRYIQVWSPSPEPADVSPPFRIVEPDLPGKLRPLLRNPVPAVKEYADGVVAGLIRDGQLPADCIDPRTFLPKKQYHERVARALCHHLVAAAGLTYTTDIRRARADLDPVEDFLFHTRAGHCERFSSALALMLRSQGIPAVRVLGFRGCEPTAVPGRYLVRQEHAHAWVDALIEVYRPAEKPGQAPWSCWLSLDPTPTVEATAALAPDNWLSGTRVWLRTLYQNRLTVFDWDWWGQLPRRAGQWLSDGWGLVGLTAGAILSALVAQWLVRRSIRSATNRAGRTAPRLQRLLAVLGRRGYHPGPGQTPREFAVAVGECLRRHPATAYDASLPLEYVEAYYAERFGGRPASETEWADREVRLDRLARALASVPAQDEEI